MDHHDYVTVYTPRSAKEQLVEFLQLLFMLLVIGGMIWAVIEFQHTDDYYTDGTL